MLKWRRNYQVGEGIKAPIRVQARINAGKFVPNIWLVTLPSNPDNQLDLIPAGLLAQRRFYDRCPEILAMAKNEEQAHEFIREMAEKVYRETGDCDLRSYFAVEQNR